MTGSAKQSIARLRKRTDGLLRFARNDWSGTYAEIAFAEST
jgi:hypothetical protein